MNKNLKIWLHGLSFLLILILFFIPFGMLSTDVKEYKDSVDIKINKLNFEIDSLRNELKNKKDTLIINPIKLEIYECKQS